MTKQAQMDMELKKVANHFMNILIKLKCNLLFIFQGIW